VTDFDFDLFVIGGGSGGVRAGRVAATLGKRVGIAEEYRYGGTCVIRGCVPKKLMVYASEFSDYFHEAAGFGWTVGHASFDWSKLVAAKEREITRLEGLYRQGLDSNKANVFESRAELISPHTIRLLANDKTVTAAHILIATGARPNPHKALPGYELCISSNEVFDLPVQPKALVIEGGGYIALEFANIFHGLGTDVTVVYRGKEILSRFDHDVRQGLHKAMVAKGIRILIETKLDGVRRGTDGRLHVIMSNGEALDADQVLLAVGRVPNTQGLGLEACGVSLDKQGAVIVDSYSRTSSVMLQTACSSPPSLFMRPCASLKLYLKIM
jgi:glutathione reductase (NADPH)